jgi:hypothetical protein
MHRGEIFLHSGKGPVAWLIKRITKSPWWSHAGWVLEDHHAIEADAQHGVEKEPFPYDIERCQFIALKVDPKKMEDCLRYVESQVGKPYDYKLILGLFRRWLFGWDRTKKVRDWSAGYICSELVAKPVHDFFNIVFTPQGVHYHNTVPGDISIFAKMYPNLAEITYTGSAIKEAV